MKRRETGILGEKLAKDYLKKRGYRIRETNYRCPEGEADIIAEHEDCLVFVEVKTRRSLEFGIPEESITAEKRERLRAVAARYQQEHGPSSMGWSLGCHKLPRTSVVHTSQVALKALAVDPSWDPCPPATDRTRLGVSVGHVDAVACHLVSARTLPSTPRILGTLWPCSSVAVQVP